MREHFDDLKKKIVDRRLCIQCGACVSMCPFSVLEISDYPKLVGECAQCGACHRACPQMTEEQPAGMAVLSAFTAEAGDAEVRKAGQSGGVVSALLISLLERGYLDSAVLTGSTKDWRPFALVAKNRQEVLSCAGSKYSRCPVFPALKKACSEGERVGFVGLPCQVRALRLLQKNFPSSAFSRVRLAIGLFCGGAFSHRFFEEVIEGEFGIGLERILKFDVGGRQISCHTATETIRIPLSRAEPYKDPACLSCRDFSAEQADISVGSAGSSQGRSSLIVRSEAGAEAVELAADSLICTDVESPLEIRRLEEKKAKRAEKFLEELLGNPL